VLEKDEGVNGGPGVIWCWVGSRNDVALVLVF